MLLPQDHRLPILKIYRCDLGILPPINDRLESIRSHDIIDTNQGKTRRQPRKKPLNNVERDAGLIASTRGDAGKSASNRQLFLESLRVVGRQSA
ncbi:hypothetical protein PanWU01x14_035650 [Parasponia andersonii]|uniref:Uncharacterized protein n=1 Tax=Parasponia andersonii TaxID=3476 RepID=A0A2P5DT94_PARAD|nr:hypothetical protein PanWU01x14_035650 [Parasponia andersonii]